ncbi:sulfatase-like hydrolase/transferase [Armatimonas sp.]|uniref:sulfatase-like hydrolase/transferase n=1 Tax=Armatimonas sp. TaxID=1872638 RepID=UPI00286C5BDE|nr:sulfatase-like hydrolase/transferase [Armatimonas sp.]
MNALLLPLLLLASRPVATQTEKPNIIYFLVDDLGYADCGFNGGKDIKTPNIDKLAKEGAILKSFYVQPVCSPTRSALMTGRYATHTGVYTIVRPNAPWGLPLTERLLPQALHEVGYTTAICGKWHLGDYQPSYTPTRRGFDHQYGHLFGAIDYFTHLRDGKPDWYRNDKPLQEEGYSTHLVAKEASRLIREQPKDKPLFLYLPFNGIHAPHQVPESYEKPYASLPKPRRTIAGMLAAVDEAIGQVVATLDEKGLRKNTLIIFSSDNGGPGPGKVTMNTPLRAGKGTIYEGGIRAASFATWPGRIPAGQTIHEPLHAVDWLPTLVKLTGATSPQKLPVDGLDIWPVLTKKARSPHDAILLAGTKPGTVALRRGDWKLLVGASEADAEEGSASEKPTGKLELYNLADDISEKNNLAASHPEKVKELRLRLDAFLKDAVPSGADVVKTAKPTVPTQNTSTRNALFDQKDTNQDGKLSLEEFLKGPSNQTNPKQAEARFKNFDTNKDGSLSREEFVSQGKIESP